jgi:hypothetical protein
MNRISTVFSTSKGILTITGLSIFPKMEKQHRENLIALEHIVKISNQI